MLDNLDFEQLNLSSNSEKLTELKKDISQRDSDIRRRARELGYEYKGSGKILGTGNGVPQEAYKIRKYVLIHIIEHPELAKRGCFKAVWLEKYGHIMDYIDLNLKQTKILVFHSSKLQIMQVSQRFGGAEITLFDAHSATGRQCCVLCSAVVSCRS